MTKKQAEQLIAFEQKFKEANSLYGIRTEITLMPYDYGDEITDFIQFCYDNNLVNTDCHLIEKELIVNRTRVEWFSGLSEEKIIQCIGYFIRGDRFCDGLLGSAIEDATITLLLKRIKAIHVL